MNNDLISRSALLELVHNHVGGTVDCNDIARFPAVDAEVVRHSMWLEYPSSQNTRYWACLNCDTVGSPRWKRCQMCECKMDAEVEG